MLTLSQQPAKIIKVGLIGGSFLALIARPFLFELGGGHAGCMGGDFFRSGMTDFYIFLMKSESLNRKRVGP
jgi:hypothetical protein